MENTICTTPHLDRLLSRHRSNRGAWAWMLVVALTLPLLFV